MRTRICRGFHMPKVKAFANRLYEKMGGTTEHPGKYKWQDVRKSNSKSHHIFVLGAHEFSQNFADIYDLHLGRAGYFWFLWPESDLTDAFVAELIHSGFLRPDRKSIQGEILKFSFNSDFQLSQIITFRSETSL